MRTSNATGKYYCREDDHVAKSKHTPLCPFCREPMEYMGTSWRPGRKGSRTRTWDIRQEKWRSSDRGYPWPRVNPRIGRKRARAEREEALRSVPAYGAKTHW